MVADARTLRIAAAALVALALGRTTSPLCRPGSRLQVHGAWHVLCALALDACSSASRDAALAGRPPTAAVHEAPT